MGLDDFIQDITVLFDGSPTHDGTTLVCRAAPIVKVPFVARLPGGAITNLPGKLTAKFFCPCTNCLMRRDDSWLGQKILNYA